MTGLLFVIVTALGVMLPVLIFSFWGASLVLTGGLLGIVALLGALCVAVERSRELQDAEGSGGIE